MVCRASALREGNTVLALGTDRTEELQGQDTVTEEELLFTFLTLHWFLSSSRPESAHSAST